MPRRITGAAFLFKDEEKWERDIYNIDTGLTLAIQLTSNASPRLDLSIDGMQSQQFSQGIFAFLLLGIVVFSGIVIALMFSKNRTEKMRSGEKVMFMAIILGIVMAIIFGAVQLLGGFLF